MVHRRTQVKLYGEEEVLTKEGAPRQNSLKERLKAEIRENELMVEKLCKKLTSLGTQTPTEKIMIIEVGESPI